jgi:predicted lipoprotein with Yx(FWY)xxD motif
VKALSAALVFVVALGGLTACGSDAKPAANPPASAAAPADADLTDGPAVVVPTPKPEPIGLTAGTAKVGGADADVVLFKDRVVYRFEADENKPPKVNCVGDCLVIWPPLLTDGTPVKLAGVNPALVGSVRRADGFTQVTLDGWPLYLYKQDESPTDTKGEGVGGNWSVVRPDGKPVVKK